MGQLPDAARSHALRDGPRGPKGNLLVGSLPEYRRDLLRFLTRCAREYGDFVPVRVATRRGFLISDPDVIGEILTAKSLDFRKVFMLRNNRLFLGDGLLTSEGETWRTKRRLVQPVFHPDRIAGYGRVIVEEAERVVAQWAGGGVRDVQQDMMALTLRSILRCMFDTEADIDVASVARSIAVVQSRMHARFSALLPLPDSAWTPQNIPLRRAMAHLDGIVYGFINGKRQSGAGGDDLISRLMQTGGLSDRELRDEAMTMLFAGHETSALALSWAWFLLSNHPSAAQRLGAELDGVLAGRLPNTADLPNLPYTAQVLKESMRLYPPIYAFGRDALRDTTVAEHQIRAGSSAIISPWVIQRDARWYPSPEQFRPERWTPEFEHTLPRFAYCPFGGGARMCPGRSLAMTEAVLVLATLAQQYEPAVLPYPSIEPWPTFSLRSRHGTYMLIRRRQQAEGPTRESLIPRPRGEHPAAKSVI